jgi:hypothetical protein
MKHRIPIVIVLSVFMMLLFRFGITASAAMAPASASSEAALPVNSGNNEKSEAAEQITISADRTTATTSLRSAPIIISVDLSRAGDPVPDGMVVDFAISSGTGTLSGATTVDDGIATVRLTSTTAGKVIVSATAGSVSATISALFLAQPAQAIIKVATVGALASGTPIGTILASVTYPASGYAIDSGGVSSSGVAIGATTTLADNVETAGRVILALLAVNGIQTGEFATLTFKVVDGFLPNIGDFSIVPDASVIASVRNSAIPGISVFVQNLTFK